MLLRKKHQYRRQRQIFLRRKNPWTQMKQHFEAILTDNSEIIANGSIFTQYTVMQKRPRRVISYRIHQYLPSKTGTPMSFTREQTSSNHEVETTQQEDVVQKSGMLKQFHEQQSSSWSNSWEKAQLTKSNIDVSSAQDGPSFARAASAGLWMLSSQDLVQVQV